MRPRTTSSVGWSKRAAATRRGPAGERRSSRSSWTARTPGSTSRAAAGRSCARCTADCRSHPELATVTMAEACASREPRARTASSPARGSTPTSPSGSAIADDQRAWSQLADAREALDAAPARPTRPPVAGAREEMLIAEGSDWFWWYGDDHSSAHDLEFDDLFRRHLRNVYRLLRQAGARRAVRQQHLARARRRRADRPDRRCWRRRWTARKPATSNGSAPASRGPRRSPARCTRSTRGRRS